MWDAKMFDFNIFINFNVLKPSIKFPETAQQPSP
jgi:hypothetical protein